MPRMGRVVVEGYPYHVVQRGHNRQVVFAAPEDYEKYLEDMRELKDAFGIRVYGYCLMTNHVHLLIGAGESPAAMGAFMKGLAGRTTRYRNRLEKGPAHSGKAATNLALCRPTLTYWPAAATSNLTLCEPA